MEKRDFANCFAWRQADEAALHARAGHATNKGQSEVKFPAIDTIATGQLPVTDGTMRR